MTTAEKLDLNQKIQEFIKTTPFPSLQNDSIKRLSISTAGAISIITQNGKEHPVSFPSSAPINNSFWKRLGKILWPFQTEELKRVPKHFEQVAETIEKMGLSRRLEMYNQKFSQALEARAKVAENAPAKTWGEPLAVGIDAGSLVGNAWTIGENGGALVSSTAATSAALLGLGVLRGVAAFISGLGIAAKSAFLGKKAAEVNDGEGVVNQGARVGLGLSYSALGGAMLVGNAASLSGATATAAQAGLAATGAGFIMQGFLLSYAAYGISIAKQFKNEMDGHLRSGSDEALVDALIHLRKKVTVSPWEKSGDSDKPLKKKWAEFERRAGSEALDAIMQKDLGALIEGLKAKDETSKVETKKLLTTVYESNYRARVRFVFLIAIGIVSTAAFIAGLLCTGGLGNLFFFFGALLWLGVDSTKLNQAVGDWAWNHRKNHVLPEWLKDADIKPSTARFLGETIFGAITVPLWILPAIAWLHFQTDKKTA